MKYIFALVLALASMNAFAASGSAKVSEGGEETVLTITGNAARVLYNQMKIPAIDDSKNGEHIKCILRAEDEFTCYIRLADKGPGNLNGRCGL